VVISTYLLITGKGPYLYLMMVSCFFCRCTTFCHHDQNWWNGLKPFGKIQWGKMKMRWHLFWGNDPQELSIIIPFPHSHPFPTFSTSKLFFTFVIVSCVSICWVGRPRCALRVHVTEIRDSFFIWRVSSPAPCEGASWGLIGIFIVTDGRISIPHQHY
jgi:hypothetical protein